MATAEHFRLEPEIGDEHAAGGLLEVELRVPRHLDVWPGHFQGFPIVPGVLQIDWVMRVASRWLGPQTLKEITALKFRRPIAPGDRLILRLRTGPRPGRLDFEFTDKERFVSQGRLELESEAP